MILDETRERFIKAIAKQVDPARIAEVHFFAPIRQAGVESGVAVIAAAERALEAAPATPVVDVVDAEPTEAASSDETATVESEASEPSVEEDPSSEAAVADESPYSDVVEASAEMEAEAESVADASSESEEAPAPIERHVIYTARYRLTLKGPDRGKWETHVTAEADAPIITVDAVVRGVQRRAGDVDDPTRMSGEEIRSAIPAAV